MTVSFPKPHRPNTSATRTGPANDCLVTIYNDAGQKINEYKFDAYSTTALGRRAYGTGYPLTALGDGRFFKKPAAYAIFGKVLGKTRGTCVVNYTSGRKGIAKRFVGTSSRSLRGLESAAECPYFSGDNFVGMSSNTKIRLGTEVMLKVGSKKASFGEALAESGKTIRDVSHAVINLAEALHDARKGRWASVAKRLGVRPKDISKGHSVSEKWLAAQYGWLPLMSDIHDGIELVKKGFREKAQIASNVRHLKDSHSYNLTFGTAGFVRTKSSVGYTAKVFYKINNSELSKLNQMGLINPLSVAWEIVPFSFVVDWLIPVGNTLEALTARLGVDFIGGYYGTRAECSLVHCDPEGADSGQIIVSDDRTQTADYFGYTREVMIGFPVPGFYYKSPFSKTHALNALALISQLTKRKG